MTTRLALQSDVTGSGRGSAAATSVLALPYRWFANIVALREKSQMAFPAVFGVIVFVSFARAELEVITTHSASATASGILNNLAFYLQSAYLYALLASRIARKPLERVSGIVVMGVFLGVFPPLLDVMLGSTDHGFYRYIQDGFARFNWSLINPVHYSSGEAITLWLLVVVLGLYVLQVTRSIARGLLALVLSYAAVVFIAMGPSTAIAVLHERGYALPFARTTSPMMLTVVQLLLAQAAYLAVRPTVAARLARRFIHAAPFVALTVLGSAVAEYFSRSGLSPLERLRFVAVVACLIFDLCIVALVQNDAYDAEKDGRSAALVSRDDATSSPPPPRCW